MKRLLFLLIFVCIVLKAQTHRFYYSLEYKLDSLQEIASKKTMVLDINPETVKYYDIVFLVKDSINKRTNSQNTNWTDQTPITRNRNSYKNLNYRSIAFDIFSYPTEDKIKWNLEKEVKSYKELDIQKATTWFGGRHWTAWFTHSIPFNEGPYKFQGLPGLIVLLQDDQNTYNFTLLKSQNLKDTYDTSNILEVRYGNRPFPVTEKVFTQKAIEYFNDPFHDAKVSLSSNPNSSVDYYGKRYKDGDDFTLASKEEQKRILKKNNPIELNKAIRYKVIK